MDVITCKVTEGMAAQLDALAREERRSKSAVLRDALEDRLRARDKQAVRAGDLVKHLCGSLKSSPADPITDLATNPEHLRGFGE